MTEEDIRMAEEKFEESKSLAESAMYNLLENDVSTHIERLSLRCGPRGARDVVAVNGGSCSMWRADSQRSLLREKETRWESVR